MKTQIVLKITFHYVIIDKKKYSNLYKNFATVKVVLKIRHVRCYSEFRACPLSRQTIMKDFKRMKTYEYQSGIRTLLKI